MSKGNPDGWVAEDVLMYKVGRQSASRMLDGREHSDLAWGKI